ncbi:hypothetical protein [Lachnospira multipara]|jgi:uncharacterized membrane protein|uniref:hypothetical protein n=1 Tax=Lachnospira multipara TaxID=28051 RepID=UPI000488F8A4|nr:hypothetical protein [Lachnospira multipara]
MKNGKIKRVLALTIVILWGVLILSTLVISFIDTPVTNTLFRGLIYTDIVLPVVAYAMMLAYRFLRGKSKNEDIEK